MQGAAWVSRIMMRSRGGVQPLRFGDDAPYEPLLNSAATSWAGVPFELHQTSPTADGVRSAPLQGQQQLRVVVDGSFVITFKGTRRDQRFRAGPGTMSFHSQTGMVPLRVDGSARMVVVDVPRSWVERLGHDAAPPEHGVHPLATQDETARSLALAMCTEISRGAETGALFAESLSLSLLSYAFDRLPLDRLHVSGGLSDSQCRMLKRYIDERLTEDLRIDELAAVCGLRPRHFTTVFQRAFGMTPHRYVVQRRLARGANLLATSAQDIAEIALGTGFSSQSHFTTAFRQAYGTTPRQYAIHHRRVVQAPRASVC